MRPPNNYPTPPPEPYGSLPKAEQPHSGGSLVQQLISKLDLGVEIIENEVVSGALARADMHFEAALDSLRAGVASGTAFIENTTATVNQLKANLEWARNATLPNDAEIAALQAQITTLEAEISEAAGLLEIAQNMRPPLREAVDSSDVAKGMARLASDNITTYRRMR